MLPEQAPCPATTSLAPARDAGTAGIGVTTQMASIPETTMHLIGVLSNRLGCRSMGNLRVPKLLHSLRPPTVLRCPLYMPSRVLDIPAYLGWGLTQAIPCINRLRYVMAT